MHILEEINKIVLMKEGVLTRKKGRYTFEIIIAERKIFFLSKKRLKYIAIFRISEDKKELKFTEYLKSSGSGFSSGCGDNDISQGFTLEKKNYKVSANGISGSISEQSKLFGKTFSFNFDYNEVRSLFENAAQRCGYQFLYQISPLGL